MANRQRNLGINIRVTPAEKKKIESNARKCRLTVSEYLRKIAMKIEPKELPSKEVEGSFLRMKSVIDVLNKESLYDTDPVSSFRLRKTASSLYSIMIETLQLMYQMESKETEKDGDD